MANILTAISKQLKKANLKTNRQNRKEEKIDSQKEILILYERKTKDTVSTLSIKAYLST